MDAATLATAMGCSRDVANRYAADFAIALLAANCTTVNRAAMFCAQIGHESAGLRYMEEIASGAAYEGRRDLGNTVAGDGKRFKGRGPIQLTGRHNYGLFSRWAHGRGLVDSADYFVRNPTAVATSRWGFLAASWYWTVARPKLNAQADAGDIVAATRSINGGTNGLADRRARWERCRRLGNALLASAARHAAVAASAQPLTPDLTRRTRCEDTEMYKETPEPTEGTAKIDWPRTRFVYGFDPIGGWGGKCILRVNFGPRGGWLHLARWWIRLPDWTANNRSRMKVWDHPVGAQGTDFAIGADWETAPPARASSIELDLSAPDGVHIFMVYEK